MAASRIWLRAKWFQAKIWGENMWDFCVIGKQFVQDMITQLVFGFLEVFELRKWFSRFTREFSSFRPHHKFTKGHGIQWFRGFFWCYCRRFPGVLLPKFAFFSGGGYKWFDSEYFSTHWLPSNLFPSLLEWATIPPFLPGIVKHAEIHCVNLRNRVRCGGSWVRWNLTASHAGLDPNETHLLTADWLTTCHCLNDYVQFRRRAWELRSPCISPCRLCWQRSQHLSASP